MGSEPGSPITAGEQANGGDLFTEADGGSRPRLHKGWQPFCKDFPFTVGVATGELTNSEKKLDETTNTRCVSQGAAIMTMNG
ncbi:hypothetical protein KSF_099080 [Reticulibacter mediterranei]|uniref:Uncharacterized protein n=1 Tax=Reticulibacter mediterranei TaxID=2778369 RepID=A0A8J3IWM0_9CHLR|nr:hypothetical protein KSF_099080 [Reticulibacter mediterranei]